MIIFWGIYLDVDYRFEKKSESCATHPSWKGTWPPVDLCQPATLRFKKNPDRWGARETMSGLATGTESHMSQTEGWTERDGSYSEALQMKHGTKLGCTHIPNLNSIDTYTSRHILFIRACMWM